MNVIPLPNGDFTTVEHIEAHGPLTVTVHKFRMGDVEDPDLYAAEPLIEWQNSEVGRWIMEHSVETPMWHRQVDVANYGHMYAVEAWLKGSDHTFWQLKWGQKYVDSLIK